MMNSVNIIGRLDEKIDEHFRFLDYDLPYFEEQEMAQRRIVVKFWTKQPNTRLIMLPVNTCVGIHGHLDVDEKFGTILLVEQLEVIKLK